MLLKLLSALVLVSCLVVVRGQASSKNCGVDNFHGQLTFEECEAEFEDGSGSCLPPASCNNDQCQKKCYRCYCADKQQCKVVRIGNSEEVTCDCSLHPAGTGYGPFCNSECQEDDHCTGENRVCNQADFTCQCAPGYAEVEGVCEDIQECLTYPCPAEATCQNTLGSYLCHCPSGREYHRQLNACIAVVSICLSTPDICGPNAVCTDVPGSYECTCNTGYTLVDGVCVDINECEDGTAGCGANAYCTNLPGGFECTCNSGFEGDGFTCTDINECVVEINGGCGTSAVCVNSAGSFACHCLNPGYQWSEDGCVDIDECATNNGGCNNALCVNTDRGHSCFCQCGSYWNGDFCAPVNSCGCGSCGGGYPSFPGFSGYGGHGQGAGSNGAK